MKNLEKHWQGVLHTQVRGQSLVDTQSFVESIRELDENGDFKEAESVQEVSNRNERLLQAMNTGIRFSIHELLVAESTIIQLELLTTETEIKRMVRNLLIEAIQSYLLANPSAIEELLDEIVVRNPTHTLDVSRMSTHNKNFVANKLLGESVMYKDSFTNLVSTLAKTRNSFAIWKDVEK